MVRKFGKASVHAEQFLLENISNLWTIQICFVNFHMGLMTGSDFQTLHGQETFFLL